MNSTLKVKRTSKRRVSERIQQTRSVRFEPRYSRTSERDSNPKEPALQVVALALDLSELY